MALTNAEKQRRYRKKRRDSDPQRRSQYLKKKRLGYIQDIAVGKRKNVDQLSSRDKRQQRRTWRTNQKLCRKRKKDNQNLLTPPDSPILVQPYQQSSGAKRREKSIAKCYRDKIKLQEQLRKERKKKMMYMKRWLREKEKSTKCSVESPHSRSTKMLRGVNFNFQSKKKRNTVRRSLEFNFVLTEALKQKHRRGNQQLKRTLSNVLSSNIVRKYRCLSRAKMEIGMQNKKIQKRKYSMTQRLNKELKNFFKRDDNSRLTQESRTVKRQKVKKQKEFYFAARRNYIRSIWMIKNPR